MLSIGMEFRKGALFVRLHGELNQQTAKILEDHVNSLVLEQGIKYLVFNMEELSSIDQCGMESIVHNYPELKKHDGKIIICGLTDYLKKIIEHHPLLQYVSISNNELGAFQFIQI